MNVVGLETIEEFLRSHADARPRIRAWLCEVRAAEWRTPSDIRVLYPSASFMADNRVVFNIRGNKYRLDTKVAYNTQIVMIMRIGTHAEYNHWQF